MLDIDVYVREAKYAALKAFDAHVPTPMVVGQAISPFARGIVPGTEEVISDGVCGFAWVRIKPARGPVVKFLKSQDMGNVSTEGGWYLSSYDIIPERSFSQSMEKKEAGCQAFVETMKKYLPDLKIWMESRMD